MVDKIEQPKEEWRNKCPNCGAKATYIQGLGDKVIKEGLLPPKAKMFFKIEQGTVPPKQMLDNMPMGSTVYHYIVGMDICKKCHTVYARMVQIGTATKQPQITKPTIILPKDIGKSQGTGRQN